MDVINQGTYEEEITDFLSCTSYCDNNEECVGAFWKNENCVMKSTLDSTVCGDDQSIAGKRCNLFAECLPTADQSY